jgi:carbohydrate-selective porin OprB
MACMAGPSVVLAQTPAPETFGGDIWSRPRITGDWFGYRDDLVKHGVTLGVDYLQILQGVMSGGLENAVGYWGPSITGWTSTPASSDPGRAAFSTSTPCGATAPA